jgi:SAM-dependent methyltransferase
LFEPAITEERPMEGAAGHREATRGAEDADQAFRTQLHDMWAAVAGDWGANAQYVDDRGLAATKKMLDLSEARPGDRVLELACGPGGLGLAAATLVAPGGEVVLSDVVPEMTSIASRRASARGLDNVATAVLDLEQPDEPDDSYDVILCREGLMFVPDPALATREISRLLRPEGRLVLAVWGPRDRNPWLAVVLDAVSAQLGAPVPPPGIPGPFSLEDAQRLAALLTDAGLEEVAVSEFDVPLVAESFERWWARTCALAGPLSGILASLPEETREAIRDRAKAGVTGYKTDDGLTVPGVTLLASARQT